MEVPPIEHAHALLSDPFLLGQRLTLRTVTIAARVVRRMLVATGVASIEVPTERRGAALADVGEYAPLLERERMHRLELSPMAPNDVREVEATAPRGARHLPARLRQEVERARRLAHELLGH